MREPSILKRFEEAVSSGISVDVLCRAAAAYRDDPNRNPDKTKHAEGWLHDRRWEDEIPPSVAQLADAKARADIEETQRRLRGEGEFA